MMLLYASVCILSWPLDLEKPPGLLASSSPPDQVSLHTGLLGHIGSLDQELLGVRVSALLDNAM